MKVLTPIKLAHCSINVLLLKIVFGTQKRKNKHTTKGRITLNVVLYAVFSFNVVNYAELSSPKGSIKSKKYFL